MSKVFITGGAGLIGAHTAKRLLDCGHDVTVFDGFQQYVFPCASTFQENLEYRQKHLLNGARIVPGNTANKDHLRRELTECDPACVIHLAGLPLVGSAARVPEDALGSIVQGTANVLDAARDLSGLERFVYVSSSMVYGHFATVPLPEDAPKEPVNLYGSLKLAGELMVRTYSRQFGIPIAIVRPSAVYGPADNNQRVVQLFAERAIRGQPIKVANPATTRLDFTHVGDLAQGLELAALKPGAVGEDFNITYGGARSLADLAQILRGHFPGLVVDAESETDDQRPVRGTLDVSKARRLLGYDPKMCLEDGVADYLQYMESNNTSLLKPS